MIVGFTQFVYIYSTHNKQDHLISRTLACLWICIILCKFNSTNVWLYIRRVKVLNQSITNTMTLYNVYDQITLYPCIYLHIIFIWILSIEVLCRSYTCTCMYRITKHYSTAIFVISHGLKSRHFVVNFL